jgi:hypothetical protein
VESLVTDPRIRVPLPNVRELPQLRGWKVCLRRDGQIEAARKHWQFVLTLEPMYPSYDEPHKEAERKLSEHGGKHHSSDRIGTA